MKLGLTLTSFCLLGNYKTAGFDFHFLWGMISQGGDSPPITFSFNYGIDTIFSRVPLAEY